MTDHLKAQTIRFARLFAVAFLAQLVTAGTANLGWKTLAALGVGAVETVVRQIWPTTSTATPNAASTAPSGG